MYTKTQEKAERVLDLYNEGKTVTQIIEIEGPMSKKTVKKILSSFGINYTTELAKKNAAKPDRVVELYNAGKSLLEIEAELQLTYTTVRNILQEKCIEQRTLSQQGMIRHGHYIDETCFNELTPESLYWIGLLYADGHVIKEREYRVNLCLHTNDLETMEKYQKFLKTNIEIKKKSGDDALILEFGSQVIHTRLRELGLTHNKSYSGVPHEELKHSRDFWRGVIDGDGCLMFPTKGYRRPILHLCGTEATCQGLVDFVHMNGINSKASVRQTKGEQTWVIQYEYVAAELLANILYKNAVVYMERKYQKYLQFIEPENIFTRRTKKTAN